MTWLIHNQLGQAQALLGQHESTICNLNKQISQVLTESIEEYKTIDEFKALSNYCSHSKIIEFLKGA